MLIERLFAFLVHNYPIQYSYPHLAQILDAKEPSVRAAMKRLEARGRVVGLYRFKHRSVWTVPASEVPVLQTPDASAFTEGKRL